MLGSEINRGAQTLLLGALLQFGCAAEKPDEATGEELERVESSLAEDVNVGVIPAQPGTHDVVGDERRACNAGGTASPVRVRWADVDVESATALTAFIENTTNAEVVVRPKLHMHSPRGDFRELELPAVTVPAGQSAPLSVALNDFPVQSSGLASTATLSIEWQQEEVLIGFQHEEVSKSGEVRQVRMEAPTRYITVASDGESAAIRGLVGQRSFERAERGRGTERRLSALALADARGVRRAVGAVELASAPVVTIGEEDAEVSP